MRLNILLLLLLVVLVHMPVPACAAIQTCQSRGITVHPTKLDAPVAYSTWSGDSVMLVLTRARSVWRSADHGLTFAKMALPGADTVVNRGDVSGSGVLRIVVNPHNSKEVVFIGFGSTSWYTEDSGQSITGLPDAGLLWTVYFHPTQSGTWAGLLGTTACFHQGQQGCYAILTLTTDHGGQWRTVADHLSQFQWVQQAGRVSAVWTRITTSASVADNRLFVSHDMFATNRTLLSHLGAFHRWHGSLFATHLVQSEGSTLYRLMVSRDAGDSFAEAQLPVKDEPTEFALLDVAQEGDSAAVLHVTHPKQRSTRPDIKTGNVYISDSGLDRYAFSLRDNVRRGTRADFAAGRHLEGMMMANVLSPTDDTHVQSRITVDNGARWFPLPKPANEECPAGTKTCALHLHMTNDATHNQWTKAYTTRSAVGLVVGNGNVGDGLSDTPADLGVYMSRDAGQSWKKVINGAHNYEFGDHGSLVVLTPTGTDVDHVTFSWTQGASWEKCSFANINQRVENIKTAPHGQSSAFVMIVGDTLVGLDFGNLHTRTCSQDKGDFEQWIPGDMNAMRESTGCVLGRKTAYTRRKQDVTCKVQGSDMPAHVITNCACTRDDYECDYCYESNALMQCVQVCDDATAHAQPKPCHKEYLLSKGYRRIAGDSCQGDLAEYAGSMQPCKLPATGEVDLRRNPDLTWIAAIIVPALLIACVCMVYQDKTDDVIHFVMGLLPGRTVYTRLGADADDDSARRQSRLRRIGTRGVTGMSLRMRDDDSPGSAAAKVPAAPNATSFAAEEVELIRKTLVQNAHILNDSDGDSDDDDDDDNAIVLGNHPSEKGPKLLSGNRWVLDAL